MVDVQAFSFKMILEPLRLRGNIPFVEANVLNLLDWRVFLEKVNCSSVSNVFWGELLEWISCFSSISGD